MMFSNNLPLKKITHAIVFVFIAGLFCILACNKKSVKEDVPGIPFPPLRICSFAPLYGDSILCGEYKKNKDYIVSPVNNPGTGKYFSKPAGLVIDTLKGSINVTQSESGVKYLIGFIKGNTTDTCYSNVIVSGINYVDSIYVLAKNDTLARPYFNALPSLPPPCDQSDDRDYPGSGGGRGHGNAKCEFDDDADKDFDYDEDGDDDDDEDEPPSGQTANEQHVKVRTLSGVINLKKTLAEGAFGNNPKNGASKEVLIYYRLNDCSKKSLRKIKVKLLYYARKSDIPTTLRTEITKKRSDFIGEKPMLSYGVPRPPLIVITRDVQ